LLQIDWGEVRRFPFARAELSGKTRYFFAARLKFSRWMWVRFTSEMREETLLRCLMAVFVALGGVPWVVTADNMKTVVLGRDHANQPIWHPAYAKCAAESGFLPDACDPGAGNQKGSVENLVKPAALQVPQRVVARELADYEQYVANRALVVGGAA
jgi:transposase